LNDPRNAINTIINTKPTDNTVVVPPNTNTVVVPGNTVVVPPNPNTVIVPGNTNVVQGTNTVVVNKNNNVVSGDATAAWNIWLTLEINNLISVFISIISSIQIKMIIINIIGKIHLLVLRSLLDLDLIMIKMTLLMILIRNNSIIVLLIRMFWMAEKEM